MLIIVGHVDIFNAESNIIIAGFAPSMFYILLVIRIIVHIINKLCLLLLEETGVVEWGSSGSVHLTTPSLPQSQEVISKLKENNHHKIILRNSSSHIVQFLLP